MVASNRSSLPPPSRVPPSEPYLHRLVPSPLQAPCPGPCPDMCVGDRSPSLSGKRKLDDLSPAPRHMMQFFVRGVGSRSRVFHAHPDETVKELHMRIEQAMGIPQFEQRLIYAGRQLRPDLTLAQCGISNDSCIYLSGKICSTKFPQAWIIANNVVSWVSSARDCRKPLQGCCNPAALISTFISAASAQGHDDRGEFIKVFILSGASTALVMLYLSQPNDRGFCCKAYAEKCICLFLHTHVDVEMFCTPVLFEFCKLLHGRVSRDDVLYINCRRRLGAILEDSGFLNDPTYFGHRQSVIVIMELLPFALEIGGILHDKLQNCLKEKLLPSQVCTLQDVLSDLSNFFAPLRKAMEFSHECEWHDHTEKSTDWSMVTHHMFRRLLNGVDQCLKMVEDEYMAKERGDFNENQSMAWSNFLVILTELNVISEVLQGSGEELHRVLMARRVPLNALLSRAKRNDRFKWFLQLQDVTNFAARSNLVLMLFSEEKDDCEDAHEMLIDRSNLLAESYEYIMNADPLSLQNTFFMEFKNEDATGPGVLREWFYLLIQALFNPQNVLFLPSPYDRRRFFPNPTSAVDPLHLKYFSFCGRVVALALRQKVPVGVVFDRAFFQQLAGKTLSLEDIQTVDPVFYTSCKTILELDAGIMDSDELGLTFARATEELGARHLVELCPGGKEIVVNSENRAKYIDLLINHRFVTSVSQQVAYFAKGFADIILSLENQQLFFRSLKLNDFDLMLGGAEGDIHVDDWKKYTEYNGYTKNDLQIKWFWKVVEEMPMERRRVLVTFWTSLRHLPSEGFGGLTSKLFIHRSLSSTATLPTSHTCFYQLCIPEYPLLKIMRERLYLITEEYMGTGFGTW